MRRMLVLLGVAMLTLSACAEPPTGGVTTMTQVPEPSTTVAQPVSLPNCGDIDVPYAPEDWYADTPIYVGNEAPIDEIRAFAQGLDGFRDVWYDRAHHGWIGVGFTDADVVAHQASLEAKFPGVGVVAVDMPYTTTELEALAAQVQGRLPEGMEVAGVNEVRGSIEVYARTLTPENIAAAQQAAGDAPVCLSGGDPVTTPALGPQPPGGDGWLYVGEADTMTDRESPQVIAAPEVLSSLWGLLGIRTALPEVDFEKQVVLVLVMGYSGSCPVTRLDDIVVEGDLIYAVIPTITEDMACTADWNPRTYLVALDRDRLPPPPFRVSTSKDQWQQVMVSTDLRVRGSVPKEGDIEPFSAEPVREATPIPYWIEPLFPWTLTIDVECGVDYLGDINGAFWHRSDGDAGLPPEWEQVVVDGLLDLELLMTEGPAPTLTASAAGVDVSYLPGPETEMSCG